MFKKLLLTTALLVSSTFGSDIDFTSETESSNRTLTTQITSKTKVNKERTETTKIILSGEVNFYPKYPDGAQASISTIFRTVLAYVNGQPNDICFKLDQSFEEGGQFNATLTAEDVYGNYKTSFGKSTELVLSFDARGKLDLINPGKKSQSRKYIDLTLRNKTSKHTITLDLRNLRKSTKR